jgi:hypothetical protein
MRKLLLVLLLVIGVTCTLQAQEPVFDVAKRYAFDYERYWLTDVTLDDGEEYTVCGYAIDAGYHPIWVGYITNDTFNYNGGTYNIGITNSQEYYILLDYPPYLLFLNRLK